MKITQLDIINNANNLTVEEIMQFDLVDLTLILIEKITWEDIIRYKKKISPKVFFTKANIPLEELMNNKIVFNGVEYKIDNLPQQRLNHLHLINYELMLEFIDIDKTNTRLIDGLAMFFTSKFFTNINLIDYSSLIASFKKNKNVSDDLKTRFENLLLKVMIKSTENYVNY